MKRDFLRELGIDDALIDKIMGENGKDVEAAKGDVAARAQELSARDTEITELKAQLAKRDSDMEALKKSSGDMDTIQKQLTELQAKYQADTNALTKKLQDQKTEFDMSTATEKFFSGVEFSSPLARDAAISQFKGKGFKLDNGVFQGGKEWLDSLKKDMPEAFKQAAPEGNKPSFTPTTPPNGNQQQGNNNPFAFNFTPVRANK